MRGTAPVSAGRVLWLLAWSGEGAFEASRRGGPEFLPWTTSTTLEAGSLNALQGANWQRGGGNGAKPKPTLPPEDKRPKSRAARPTSNAAREARRAAMRAGRRPHVQRGGLGVPEDDPAS